MGNEASTASAANFVVKWEKSTTAGTSPAARDGHVFVSAPGHSKAYLFGGMSQQLVETDDFHVYDASTNTWSQIEKEEGKPWPIARANAAAALFQGKLYMFGGMNADAGGWLGDIWVYDIAAKTWATPAVTGQLPTPRDKLACTVVGDHLVFYGGFGPTIEEVDDDDDDGAGAGGGAGVGGADASAPAADCATFGWFNDAYVFTAATGGVGGAALKCQKVQVGGFGPSARCAHAMCTIEGKAAVFGGRDSVGRTNDLFYLLPPGFDGLAGWNWSKPSAMGKGPAAVSFHTATALDNQILVVGGRNDANDHVAAVHAFDTVTGQWTTPELDKAGDPHKRGNHAICVMGGGDGGSGGGEGTQQGVVAFGGSSMYDEATQCCRTFYGDTYQLTLRAAAVAASGEGGVGGGGAAAADLEGNGAAKPKRPASLDLGAAAEFARAPAGGCFGAAAGGGGGPGAAPEAAVPVAGSSRVAGKRPLADADEAPSKVSKVEE